MDANTRAHDPLYHECAQAAAAGVFQATCGVTLAPAPSPEAGEAEVVVAAVGLTGQVDGSVFIALPSGTACGLVMKFVGMDLPFDSADMNDAVGELANIVAGDVKARLDARGVQAEISLPAVIRVRGVEALASAEAAATTCYTCQAGPLWVGVTGAQPGDLRA